MFKKQYIHEATGDVLTFSEQISWKIQGLIRNWYFVIAWTVLSGVWFATPKTFGDNHSYVHWQLLASWLAVTVELIIGIAMIGQTKRDAQILRHILKLEKQEISLIEDLNDNI
jgi:hypothetical protein